jgi:hypothetical protein
VKQIREHYDPTKPRAPFWWRLIPRVHITHPRLGRLTLHLLTLWLAPCLGWPRWIVHMLDRAGRALGKV